MNNKPMILMIAIFIISMGFYGCIEEENNTNGQNNQPTENILTDEDWDYFVFHYLSGKDLHTLYSTAGDLISNEIYFSDSANYTYLIELNIANQQTLAQLKNLSEQLNANSSQYIDTLQTFTLSTTMKNHSELQNTLFVRYLSLSQIISSIYDTIFSSTPPTNTSATVIDISVDMIQMLSVSELITDLLDEQVDIITLQISDEEWEEWTKDRDWSFME